MTTGSSEPRFVLTFDYEVFLGADSGTARQSILAPVDRILKLFAAHGARGVFFVDAAWLLRLAEDHHPDFRPVEDQLHALLGAGNSVELHLHPQWLDAYPIGPDRWSFRTWERYTLHALEEPRLGGLIRSAKQVLDQVVRGCRPEYRITAFRAGGWCCRPFERFRSHLLDNGIWIDSSVRAGIVMHDELELPRDVRARQRRLAWWRFDTDPCCPGQTGPFIELPVSTCLVWSPRLLWNRWETRGDLSMGDGKVYEKPETLSGLSRRLRLRKLRGVTIDYTSRGLMHYCLRKLNRKNLPFSVLVSHPKNITSTGLSNLERLVRTCRTLNLEQVKELIGPVDGFRPGGVGDGAGTDGRGTSATARSAGTPGPADRP